MDRVIGIDLGTTNSAVAFLTPDGPVIIENALGARLTPSVVGVDDSGSVSASSWIPFARITAFDSSGWRWR